MVLEIQTEIIINLAPTQVWSFFTKFNEHQHWNPFITSIKGDVKVGNSLEVRIEPPGAKAMIFKPEVLTYVENKELSWVGKVLFTGVFDGKHKFELIDNGNGTTTFIQKERFSGFLVSFFKGQLNKNTKNGFIDMNNKLKEHAEQYYNE